jgi:hypothetical protein
VVRGPQFGKRWSRNSRSLNILKPEGKSRPLYGWLHLCVTNYNGLSTCFNAQNEQILSDNKAKLRTGSDTKPLASFDRFQARLQTCEYKSEYWSRHVCPPVSPQGISLLPLGGVPQNFVSGVF